MAELEHPDGPWFRDLLGFRHGHSDSPGTAWADLEIGPQHLNPHGHLHGAVPYALVDTAMGMATYSMMAPGQTCTTIEIHLRYLRPATDGTIRAEVRVLRPGSRVVHLEGRVLGEDGKEIAFATGSYAVLPRPEPREDDAGTS